MCVVICRKNIGVVLFLFLFVGGKYKIIRVFVLCLLFKIWYIIKMF